MKTFCKCLGRLGHMVDDDKLHKLPNVAVLGSPQPRPIDTGSMCNYGPDDDRVSHVFFVAWSLPRRFEQESVVGPINLPRNLSVQCDD